MKYLLPIALAIFVSACSTPEPPKTGTAAHQQQLYEEARANFMAMKAQERKNTAAKVASRRDNRTESVRRTEPSWTNDIVRRIETFWRTETSRRTQPRHRRDDTLYYHEPAQGRRSPSAHYRAAEARYAHELAKNPEDLRPEEREWAHRHY